MSEPRYPTRVSDPDETTRIPKEALDGLSSSAPAPVDRPPAKDANGHQAPANGSVTGAPSSPGVPAAGPAPTPRNGSSPAPSGSGSSSGANGSNGANGFRADGSGGSRPSLFGGSPSGTTPAAAPSTPGFGSGSGGSGSGSGGSGSGYPGSAGSGSGSGYSGRSETGYSPAAYPSTNYSPSNYSSLGSQPTTVNAPVGAPLGGGVATAPRPAPSGSGRTKGRGAPGRPARRARLLVRHIDPWSTLKFSFVLAVAMFFVWLVAIGVLYGVLDGMGVFEQINGLYSEVAGNGTESLFTPSLVLGTAALVGAVNIVLFTALATIGAFVYNICADLVGGIEVTLAERD
jgi:hypothetical protein